MFSASQRRTRELVNILRRHLKAGQKVLDIGAGRCKLAYGLKTELGVDITPIDIVDHNVTPLKLKLYDGYTLPYGGNKFDVTLLSFVLHHAKDQKRLVEESLRVGKTVVVIEDTPNTRFEKFGWFLIDYTLNHARHRDISVAMHTKSAKEWQKIFEKAGATVTHTEHFRAKSLTGGLYPHTLFILKKLT